MPMINVDVPLDVRTALKRWALDHDCTMRDAVELAIRRLTSCDAPSDAPSTAAERSEAPESAPDAADGATPSNVAAPIEGASWD